MEKFLREFLYREYSPAFPFAGKAGIADMIDDTIAKIKKQDEEAPSVICAPPVEPEAPQPAWRRKIGGLEQRRGAEIGKGKRVVVAKRAAVEAVEEEVIVIRKNPMAEVLLPEAATDINSATLGRNGDAKPKTGSKRSRTDSEDDIEGEEARPRKK